MTTVTSSETRVYLNFCGKELESLFNPISSPKGRFSQWLDRNYDVVLLISSVVLTVLAILFAFSIIPTISPMFLAGCFATGAAFLAMLALMTALRTRGCITVRYETASEAIEHQNV